MNQINVYPKIKSSKDPNKRIVAGLTYQEAQCKCKFARCTRTLVSQSIQDFFTKVRSAFGPIFITNLYRCVVHNQAIGGVHFSEHIFGNAIGLAFQPLLTRHKLKKSELAALFCDAGATFIKFYDGDGHVHVDCRTHDASGALMHKPIVLGI